MSFKLAKCPNCGGSLQVPEDRSTVHCMYCGGEVVVREAIQLAAGRAKAYTPAKSVETTYQVSAAKPGTPKSASVVFIGIGAAFIIAGLFIAANPKMEGGGCCGGGIVLASFLFILMGWPRPGTPAVYKTEITHWDGECPYCASSIMLQAGRPGGDCPACHKRIVIREEKFISVDTPVSGVKESE